MDDKKVCVTLTTVLCITFLEAIALYQGIDGRGFVAVMTILGGLAGLSIKRVLDGLGLELIPRKRDGGNTGQ